ncbi:mercury(II) reductase [Paralimibaculum aggregatum]|uniref:Mercuric reductase n=1 Tax=Paralimibaculum aggregatum TaxID=3036245 RepID=A0ABQ6LRC3_9RHOB|nr:mercury(II) reductase [Limibaculum sp. NKW23]GMG84523.1 mercury(II) reductase [Limibaculum sp. NKW23]
MSDRGAPGARTTFDLAVIGAGSAGFSAAITAAEAGARVALIGSGTIGGTCVNVGCVPSKALIRAVEPIHQARAAARFDGIEAEARVTGWRAAVAQKQALVDELRAAKYVGLLPSYDRISYLPGAARFEANGRLVVGGDAVAAGRIVVATGSRPALPGIPGIETVPVLDSTSALDLETVPPSLLVIGAGYVGAELAQVFARAGARVTLVSRRGLLPEAEPEISHALTGYLGDEGIASVSGIAYERIERTAAGAALRVRAGGETRALEASAVLVATGRRPNTEALGLRHAGIETDARGSILVDDAMRTTRAGVYAAGDVTGRDQFVYMAAYGARIAATNALNGDSLRYDATGMPAVVFTDPNLATVGYTEAAAKAAGIATKTSVLALEHVPRALAARDTRGLIKLVADAGTRKLIGAHILAPEGADSIQTAALAIRAGMTHDELGATIFPYLTTVEGLKLAAQTFDRDVGKLSCCAG